MQTLVSINAISFIFIIGLQVQIIIKFKNRETTPKKKKKKKEEKRVGWGGGWGKEQPKTKEISKKENIFFYLFACSFGGTLDFLAVTLTTLATFPTAGLRGS